MVLDCLICLNGYFLASTKKLIFRYTECIGYHNGFIFTIKKDRVNVLDLLRINFFVGVHVCWCGAF